MTHPLTGIFAASAVALSLVNFEARAARAAEPPLDASQYTASCSTVTGTVSFKPALVTGGTAPTTIRIKGTLDGCRALPPPVGGAKLRILPGSRFSGEFTGASNDCASLMSLLAPVAGSVTIKWKTSPEIASKTSVVSFPQESSVSFDAPWAGSYVNFTFGGKTAVSGSFAGANGAGGSSTMAGIYSQDAGVLMDACNSAVGLKTLDIGLGAVSLQ